MQTAYLVGQSVTIFWLAWGVCAPVCECVMIAMKHFASLPWQTAVRPPQADQSGRTDQPLPEGVHSRRH